MTLTLKVTRSAVKFLPTSQEVNRPNDRQRRGEERQYLLGAFATMSSGEEDTKKLIRVWFTHLDHHYAAWELASNGFGVLVVGDYKETDTDYDNQTLSLSNASIARYDKDGLFVYLDAQGKEEVIEGEPLAFVTLDIETRVSLISAPALDATPPKRKIGLKERHRLAQLEKEKSNAEFAKGIQQAAASNLTTSLELEPVVG